MVPTLREKVTMDIAMNDKDIVGICRCPGCGRICIGVSQAAAERDIANCAAYVESLAPAERESRTGDTPESLTARYNACGACGTPSSEFLPAKIEDAPRGITLQPIIAPPLSGLSSQKSGGASNSEASQKRRERKVTFDEVQEMASNGELERFLDDLGIPDERDTPIKRVKRRMGEGKSFDRSTFNQAEYDRRLLEDNE